MAAHQLQPAAAEPWRIVGLSFMVRSVAHDERVDRPDVRFIALRRRQAG